MHQFAREDNGEGSIVLTMVSRSWLGRSFPSCLIYYCITNHPKTSLSWDHNYFSRLYKLGTLNWAVLLVSPRITHTASHLSAQLELGSRSWLHSHTGSLDWLSAGHLLPNGLSVINRLAGASIMAVGVVLQEGKKWKLQGLLRPRLWTLHIISATCYWSKQITRPTQLQRTGKSKATLDERSCDYCDHVF